MSESISVDVEQGQEQELTLDRVGAAGEESINEKLQLHTSSASVEEKSSSDKNGEAENGMVGALCSSAKSENGLKMKISTSLGKSWINNSYFSQERSLTNGRRRSGDEGSGGGDEVRASTSRNAFDQGEANGLKLSVTSDKSDEETGVSLLADDEKISSEVQNAKKKLSCTSRTGRLLSHWQIMNKCLNKKLLFEALTVPRSFPITYQCPACEVTKTMPQHMLFHMRAHKDLTSAFQVYQNYEQTPNRVEIGNSGATAVEVVKIPGKRGRKKKSRDSYLGGANNETSDSDGNKSDYPFKGFGKRQRRRRSKRRKRLRSYSRSAMTSDGSMSDDSDCQLRKRFKSVTDFEESASDEDRISNRLRKRSRSLVSIYGEDFISDPYDSHNEEDMFDGMLEEDFSENVSLDNPHYCQICSMKFIRGSGMHRHYAKHNEEMKNRKVEEDDDDEEEAEIEIEEAEIEEESHKKRKKKKMKNGICQTTLSYKINSSILTAQDKKDAQTLQELEETVNKVLEYFVRDNEVLVDLGWPDRNVSELINDILDRCELFPVYSGDSKLSKLQCLRLNVSELLTFCLKDEVMDMNGWKDQLVDDVVIDLIEKANNSD